MTNIETLKLTDPHDHPEPHTMKWTQLEMDYINKRVEATIRQAIAEAEQAQPVAWVSQANLNSAAITRNRGGQGDTHTWSETPTWDHSVPLYTAPPPRHPWVGLTDEERDDLIREFNGLAVSFYKAIEAKLKEKNT